MGGIGITLNSTDEGRTSQEQSSALTSLPQDVVAKIAETLGIQTNETKQALLAGKIDLPDNVTVTITRKITGDYLTLKKLSGGAQYELTYKDKVTKISPGAR